MAEAEARPQSSLEIAKRYTEQIPAPSSMFTAAIRAIRNAEQVLRGGDQNALKDLAINSTSFLVSISPTLKTVFYRAAQDLHAEELKTLQPLSMKGLLRLFSTSEITAVLTLTYLYRHLKRHLPEDPYQKLTKKMLTHIEIGAIVGRTIKYIGVGNGMLLGGLRYAGLALFMAANEKKYTEYRRKVEREDKLFDVKLEREIFQCTSLEVASQLVRSFGFGLVTTSGFAFADSDDTPPDFSEQMAEELLCWRVAIALTEAFHLTGAAPDVGEDSVLYLPPEESAVLQKQCWGVVRDGSTFTWLTASRKDLPPEVCTALEIVNKTQTRGGIEELEEGEETGA